MFLKIPSHKAPHKRLHEHSETFTRVSQSTWRWWYLKLLCKMHQEQCWWVEKGKCRNHQHDQKFLHSFIRSSLISSLFWLLSPLAKNSKRKKKILLSSTRKCRVRWQYCLLLHLGLIQKWSHAVWFTFYHCSGGFRGRTVWVTVWQFGVKKK